MLRLNYDLELVCRGVGCTVTYVLFNLTRDKSMHDFFHVCHRGIYYLKNWQFQK